MSKATVLALVQTLAGDQADVTTLDRYYTEAVFDLGTQQWLTQAALFPLAIGDETVVLPDNVIAVLDAVYDDVSLDFVPLSDLEAIQLAWRDQSGRPQAYLTEDEPANTLRLWPTPNVPSGDFIWLHGAPLGLDFPQNAICLFHTETRDDLPAWLELPTALRVCSLEFERESDHRDPVFARRCAQLADVLLQAVS